MLNRDLTDKSLSCVGSENYLNMFYNPVRTYQGAGAIKLLPQLAKEAGEGKTTLILLWTKALENHSAVRELIDTCGGETMVFSASNPDINDLYDAYIKTKDMDIGLIIAIGGGSVLDVGKSLCCILKSGVSSVRELREYIAEKKYGKPCCPWIGVPTTAGTGSEVTCWATVWDREKGLKHSVDTSLNYAYGAVVDPELLYSMPLQLAVSSALDAAAHAAESYWAKATNAVSRAFALEAVRSIMENIEQLLNDPKSPAAHGSMSLGSMLAGLAFSGTRTTACHSISYPLTMSYDIPHGTAVAMLLAPVAELNRAYTQDFQKLIDAFGVDSTEELGVKITGIIRRSGCPFTLSQWGVKIEDIKTLAGQSITRGRADNNPAEITEEIVAEMLNKLL